MECYTLKSHRNANDFMTIVKKLNDGFVVRIVRDCDGYNEVVTDFMSKSLFDSCIRTGYITKVESSNMVAETA
jgi:hypothetical protein